MVNQSVLPMLKIPQIFGYVRRAVVLGFVKIYVWCNWVYTITMLVPDTRYCRPQL